MLLDTFPSPWALTASRPPAYASSIQSLKIRRGLKCKRRDEKGETSLLPKDEKRSCAPTEDRMRTNDCLEEQRQSASGTSLVELFPSSMRESRLRRDFTLPTVGRESSVSQLVPLYVCIH